MGIRGFFSLVAGGIVLYLLVQYFKPTPEERQQALSEGEEPEGTEDSGEG